MFVFCFLSLFFNLAFIHAADEKACGEYVNSTSCCINSACTWSNCSIAASRWASSCVNVTWLVNGTVSSRNITCFISDGDCNAAVRAVVTTQSLTTATKGLTNGTTAPTTATTVATTLKTSTARTTVSNTTATVGNRTSSRAGTTVTMTRTHSPTVTTQPTKGQACLTGSRFDGASFVGGIVLCAGMVLICGFIYKYYQSRVVTRYHQF